MEFGGNGPSGSSSPSGLPRSCLCQKRRNGVKAERKQVPETVRQATEDVDPSVNFIMALQSVCGWICGDGKEGGFPNTKFVRTKVSPGN